MKFKAHAAMKSCPDFTINTEMNPLPFETSMSGAFEGTIGSISVKLDEIPIRMAIPFMKPRGRLPVIAAIGGFKMKLQPFNIKIDNAAVHLKGQLGDKALRCKMEGKVNCQTEVDMNGKLAGKSGTIKFELDEEVETQDTA